MPAPGEAITDLTNGRLDAVISDKFVLVDWLKKSSDGCCKLVGDVKGTETQAGIAVRLDDTAPARLAKRSHRCARRRRHLLEDPGQVFRLRYLLRSCQYLPPRGGHARQGRGRRKDRDLS
ncbi:hypothetical protein [Mesorhizobium sp. 113-3-3]|uniref:hypothetical protein n=1 Tax=Mesorhizobium sp. 113-3-3 TaxID=2744516 RepID=UPI00406C3F3C